MRLHAIPLSLREANAFVDRLHRHHKASRGHRFSIGCIDDDGVLRGVVIVGRPVARLSGSMHDVAEVTRLCTDGSDNACSFLYAAAARACKEMGYLKIQTYILESETGISLKASGWVEEASVKGRQWAHTDGRPRRTDQPTDDKRRWAKYFRERPKLLASSGKVTDE